MKFGRVRNDKVCELKTFVLQMCVNRFRNKE